VTQRCRSSVAVFENRRPCTYVLDQRIRYEYSQPVTNLRQRLRVVRRQRTDCSDDDAGV
jgi:hypothetical protein